MKVVGLNKEKDSRIIKNEYLIADAEIEKSKVEIEEKMMILNYLNNADSIISMTLSVFDGTHYIGSYGLFCDGVWIWPSHLSYYFNKTSDLNSDFLHYIRCQNYAPNHLSILQKKEALSFLELSVLNR